MILTDTFYSDEENALSEEFLRHGYVVKPVADRSALDAMRTEVVNLVCSYLNLDFPDEVGLFLNRIQNSERKSGLSGGTTTRMGRYI